jgi:hypothetical protein
MARGRKARQTALESLPMRFPALLLALLALPATGDEEEAARALFRKAVEAQAAFAPEALRDVRLEFEGQIREEGDHAVARLYLYRAADRSFRIRTAAKAEPDRVSERGVLGEGGYWERDSRGRIEELSLGSETDAGLIHTIERERRDFEEVLRLVFLERLDDGRARFRLGEPAAVALERDRPFNDRQILGAARRELYRALRIERADLPPLTLFVHADDHTIRKAIVHKRARPEEPAWIYYFGQYTKAAPGSKGVNVPRLVSIHVEEPVDEASRERGVKAYGTLRLTLNAGLADADLRPTSP